MGDVVLATWTVGWKQNNFGECRKQNRNKSKAHSLDFLWAPYVVVWRPLVVKSLPAYENRCFLNKPSHVTFSYALFPLFLSVISSKEQGSVASTQSKVCLTGCNLTNATRCFLFQGASDTFPVARNRGQHAGKHDICPCFHPTFSQHQPSEW